MRFDHLNLSMLHKSPSKSVVRAGRVTKLRRHDQALQALTWKIAVGPALAQEDQKMLWASKQVRFVEANVHDSLGP